jgi:acetyl esterase
MGKKRWIICLFIIMTLMTSVHAVSMRNMMQNESTGQERIYKKVGQTELKMYIFTPSDMKRDDRRPAIIWIHGGGWTGGTLDGFMLHARYFANRGIVGVNISYRLVRPEGPFITDCLADCKSAVRYIRVHAAELGIDPERIAVAGDSAGGHLAACLGVIEGFDDPSDNLSISAVPNAMILYNPIVDMTENGWIKYIIGGAALEKNPSSESLKPAPEKLELARKLSPVFNVRSGQPPTLLMHGLDDVIVTPQQARRFADAMKRQGNRCDLILLEKTGHAFVVPKWKAPEQVVVNAVRAADVFLASLGHLHGEPTLEVSKEPAWPEYKPKTK